MGGPASKLSPEERARRIRRLVAIARLMDTAFRVPGIGFTLGADSIIGLLPGIGDAGSAIISLLMINEARKLGVPKSLLMQMTYNVALDASFGSVPLLGDAFDIYFKANKRNANIILKHFDMNSEVIR